MGVPIRRFPAPESAPQPKRRRASPLSDSEATDSAPEFSVNEIVIQRSRHPPHTTSAAPTRRRVLQMMRSQTPIPPRDVMVGDSDSDIQLHGSPRIHHRRRIRLPRMPHDLSRPSGDGSGVDSSAFSDIATYYSSRNGGKAALHLCKTRNSDTGLCVVFADLSDNAVDVGNWWLIGSWATGDTIDGQTVFQVLLDVIHECISIPSCTISQLVICDELEQSDGVRAGIRMLKRLPDSAIRRRYAPAPVEDLVNAVLGDSSNSSDEHEIDFPSTSSATAAPAPLPADASPSSEIDESIEGTFTHPLSGTPITIDVE